MLRRSIFPLLLAAGLLPAASRGQETVPLCDRHDPVQRPLVQEAVRERRGLRDLHEEVLRNRLARNDVQADGEALSEEDGILIEGDGLPVAVTPAMGGGDCPDAQNRRGKAAAAVGALLYEGQMHCSAVLVAPSTVLTAAHCVQGFDRAKMEFVVGDESTSPIQRALVEKGDSHPDYDPSRFGVNDLAYLHLKRSITTVQPAVLQRLPLSRRSRSTLLHVGYGIAGPVPGRKRCVDIPLDATCERSFSNRTSGLNTCNGDSGGGVFYDEGTQIYLAGITTWGDELCQRFGVSLDVGAFPYPDWIASRISESEPAPPAPPERIARIDARPERAKEIQAFLRDYGPPQRQDAFKKYFHGKWVHQWRGRVEEKPISGTIPNSCNVLLEEDGIYFSLQNLENGCALRKGEPVSFEGSLSFYSENYFEVTFPELRQRIAEATPIGRFQLLSYAPPPVVAERRVQDFRLESSHGEWSGRIERCEPVVIEGGWTLDRSQAIRVGIAYQNHGGYGEARIQSETEFCLPLWAEGFGGFRPIDAGNKGVISGSVSFVVKRLGTAPDPVEVEAGALNSGSSLRLQLPDKEGQYELSLQLNDGRRIVTRQSFQKNGVYVDWDQEAGEIRVEVD